MSAPVAVPPVVSADPSWVKRARNGRGWSKVHLVAEVRRLAVVSGVRLPDDKSLIRLLARWESGQATPCPFYSEVLRRLFDLPRPAGCTFPTDLRALRDL